MTTRLTSILLSAALAAAAVFAYADHHQVAAKMSLAERHPIQHECERLINIFLRLFERDHADTADLFTEDGQALGTQGREAIREHFSRFDPRDVEVNVLISSNIVIDVIDKDHAQGTCYATHYQYAHPDSKREGQPELRSPNTITRWTWEFQRVDGQWYISKLEMPESILIRKDILDYINAASKSESEK